MTATATATAAATAPPTATPTPSPTPEPTATPIPALRPNAVTGGASYLWSGHVANPGIPWTSMRVTVGADPLVDPWQFEMGVIAVTRFTCTPSATQTASGDGIALGGCGRVFAATVDLATQEMTVTFNEPTSFGERSIETVLRPLWDRDEPQASDNVTMLWHHEATDASGSYTDLWVDGGVVFAPHFGGTIELLDATSGEPLGRINAAASVLDVKVRDGVLYAATTASGLLIYDVSDPSAPAFLSQYAVTVGANVDLFGNAHNIYLSPVADLVFAINDTHPQTDLRVIDVSDPARPFEAGRFVISEARSTLEGAHDVHVVTLGGRQIAFLNSLANGFYVLDVTDPAAIEVVSQTIPEGNAFSHSGWVTDLDGRLIYLNGDEGADQHLRLYDATNLEAPELLAEWQTRPGTSVHNIEIDGRYAYVSYYIDGLRVFDLEDPTSPREVAHYDTVAPEDERDILQGNWGVHLADGVVYLSDRETGITALRVELPD